MVTFQCKICKKIFDQKCHYIAHLNRQTKCIKYKKSVLKSPQLVLKSPQFDIKEYQCPYCSVFFSRKDNLKRHTRDYCKMKKKQLKMKKKIQIMQKEIDELKQQEKNQRNINGKNNTNQNITVYEPISVESKISAIKKQSNDLDMMLKTVNERFEELVNGFTK